MMAKLRFKDKIFAVTVLPLAVAGVYWWQWRPEAMTQLQALRSRDRATVGEAEFPGEKNRRLRAAAAAEAELERERAEPQPAVEVKGHPADTPAKRTRQVVEAMRSAGLRIVSAEVVSDKMPRPAGNPADVLKAARVRPEPVRRVYRVEGGYLAVARALAAFADGKMAVIVGSVANEGYNRWRVAVDE